MVEDFIKAINKSLEKLRRTQKNNITIFHHNDTDGLTVLERIFQWEGEIMVFADFAGRIAPTLSQMNRGKNLVLILDHHVATPSNDPLVINLDPDLFGLKGDRDISASTTCYLFAISMKEINHDLAFLAALGAVGDEFFVEGKLVGENRKVVEEAETQGLLLIEKMDKAERYIFKTLRGEISGEDFT